VKTQGSLPSAQAAELLLFGLIISGSYHFIYPVPGCILWPLEWRRSHPNAEERSIETT
jgi:hypothetical protein